MRQLRRGDTGEDVGAWQRALVAAGLELELGAWPVDQKYGEKTESATRSLQRRLGLEPTGEASSATQRLALFELAELAGQLASDG